MDCVRENKTNDEVISKNSSRLSDASRHRSQMRSIKTPARISGSGRSDDGSGFQVCGRRWVQRLKNTFRHMIRHFLWAYVCVLDYVPRATGATQANSPIRLTICLRFVQNVPKLLRGSVIRWPQIEFRTKLFRRCTIEHKQTAKWMRHLRDILRRYPWPGPMHSFAECEWVWVSVQRE